jgi:ribosomal protein S18 acetylase RimI-like enzyme
MPLPPKECARGGAVLGRAFHDDPLWAATFTDPDKRPELLVSMFTALAKTTVAAEGPAETTPGVDAVALWLPPGKDFGFWEIAKSGFALPRLAMRMPAPDRKRMMAVLGQLEDRKKALMPEPHWYLSAIGVHPEHQGEGLGSALVRSGIRRADRDNTPIYLETETGGNVDFYRHLGFEVIEQVTAAGLGLPVWLMLRRPPTPRT